jgi:2-keto-3-deoxy-L-rhamnonate aldolase RhmA
LPLPKGIVADCRFPPIGRRGRGFLGGHFDYGRADADQYMAESDAQIFVCIMLETAEALENIEEILAVPGLDSVCVGANDLMSALGLPYPGTANYSAEHHSVLMGAVSRCVAAAAALPAEAGDKFVGFASGSVDYCAEAASLGAHWIQMGADRVMMKMKFEEMNESMRRQAQRRRQESPKL